MRHWRCILLTLVFVALTFVIAAQEDENDEPTLGINYTVNNPLPCSRAQATELYATLDGFQQQIDSLALVRDLETLGAWFSQHNDWVDENWSLSVFGFCDGLEFLLRALIAQARYRAMDRMITADVGFSLDQMFVEPRSDALELARELAEIDLAAMEENQDPEVELALNKTASGLPRCNPDRALAFYATIDGYEDQVEALLQVESWESLLGWAFNFHLWRTEAWEDIYEQPCGAALTDTFVIEATTYMAGIRLVSGLAAQAADDLTKEIGKWRAYAERDAAAIESETRD